MIKELRPYQLGALERLRQSLRSGKRRPILQGPCGFGKTLLAAAVVDGALAKGNRVVFTVPALSLVDQTIEALWNEDIRDVGVLQGQHILTDWSKPVQVASVQTLMRRPRPKADVVIVDEAHRHFDFVGKWIQDPEWQRVPFIGLTATPYTRGLGKYYDDLIIAATTQELIDQKYLSPFRVYAPGHPDLTGVRTVAGDYHEGDLSKAMDKMPLVADIVDTWLRLGNNQPTLCFGVDCAHAKHIQERFDAAGVNAEYMDAYTEPLERERIKRKFHEGEVKVVCNVGVLTTGVDWRIRCIILARPTKSEILHVQTLGRGLRTEDGKEYLTVLDHSDTHARLGFITDIQHDSLDDGRVRQKALPREKLPRECKVCTALRIGGAMCPVCGYVSKPVNRITCDDGELIEIRPGEKHPTRQPKQYSMFEKADVYAQLKYYALTHGYKDGWVSNKYRTKFGVWPNDPSIRNAEPIEPSYEIAQWIKHEQIKFAKRRREEQRA